MSARWSPLVVVALVSTAAAAPLDDAITARVGVGLPEELAVVAVHVPRAIARRWSDVEPGAVAIEWPRAPRPGRISVRVQIDGRAVGFVPVTVAARVATFTTTRALPPGHLIGAADVIAVRQVVTAGARPAPIAVGTVTTTALASGEVIVVEAVTRPPPVARGAEVEFAITRGAITIRGRGHLAASARPGETAVVRTSLSDRDLRGTLIDDHRVVIALEAP